jgi:hypothetical protein
MKEIEVADSDEPTTERDQVEDEEDNLEGKFMKAYTRKDGKFGGISLSTELRQHHTHLEVATVEEVLNSTEDKFFMRMDKGESTSVAKVMKNIKKIKTRSDGKVISALVCYSLDPARLSDDFAIQEDLDGHFTLYPSQQISCDFTLDNDKRLGNLNLLRCGAWSCHCILFKAGAEPVDFEDHFDRSLWEGCLSLFALWSSETDSDDLDEAIKLIEFLNFHGYFLPSVAHMPLSKVQNLTCIIENHLPMISDFEDICRVESLLHTLKVI